MSLRKSSTVLGGFSSARLTRTGEATMARSSGVTTGLRSGGADASSASRSVQVEFMADTKFNPGGDWG
jgi:hypothetical protein